MPAATRVGLLYSAVQTSTVSSTTIAAATTNAVTGGDTVFIIASARGATAGTSSVSGLPADATIETINDNNAANPALGVFRCYLPSGMAASTTVTVTWDSANARKTLQGIVWHNVANQNVVATGRNASSGTPLNAGTSTGSRVTDGVHFAAYGINSTLSTNTFSPGNDEEGTMTEEAEQLVGASTFHYLYCQDRASNVIHPAGMTAPVTPVNAIALYIGWQGIWAGVPDYVDYAEVDREFLDPGPWSNGPQVFFEDRSFLSVAAAASADVTITPGVADANASALTPSVILTIPPGVANASASALGVTIIETLQPGVANSAASALGPGPTIIVPPGVANASASALVPTLRLTLAPGVAGSTATALGVGAGIVVPPGVAGASATALTPTIIELIAPGVAGASATALGPTVFIGIVVAPATAVASASALTPTLLLTVAPGIAGASASALTPAARLIVAPSVASASANAPVPTLILPIIAPADLRLTDATAYDHDVASTISFGKILTGTYLFSGSYTTGGESFVIPGVRQTVIVTVPHVGGRNFEWTGTKLKAYTAAGTEVTAGTDLSLLGAVRWWALCR